MSEAVEKFVDIAQSKDKRLIGEHITEFHRAVRTMLKIENQPIDTLVSEALLTGAFAAKTCGLRFSGGCMFALTDQYNTAKIVQSRLGVLGARTIITKILYP